MLSLAVSTSVLAQRHFRIRAAACAALAKWQTKHAPRVNMSVVPAESYTWHALAALIQVYKVRVTVVWHAA